MNFWERNIFFLLLLSRWKTLCLDTKDLYMNLVCTTIQYSKKKKHICILCTFGQILLQYVLYQFPGLLIQDYISLSSYFSDLQTCSAHKNGYK